MRNVILFFMLSAIGLSGCKSSQSIVSASSKDPELKRLTDWMTGSFSSELQSKTDTNYFNIRLIMTPIWEERADGQWLYVEQAVAAKPEKPYRQRVYHLQHPQPHVFTSDIYTIQDALSFAGLANDPAKRAKLTMDKIDLKDGCRVTLQKQNGKYTGGTEKDHCPSDLRGAKYATTKIELEQGLLVSWDQGFDSTGTQVWGATQGGYRFVKQKP